MPTEEELLNAIDNLRLQAPSYDTCQKLVVYNELLDRYYNNVSSYNSGSEFMEAIDGRPWDGLLPLLDELMDCLMVINPKLYQSFMEKLK